MRQDFNPFFHALFGLYINKLGIFKILNIDRSTIDQPWAIMVNVNPHNETSALEEVWGQGRAISGLFPCPFPTSSHYCQGCNDRNFRKKRKK